MFPHTRHITTSVLIAVMAAASACTDASGFDVASTVPVEARKAAAQPPVRIAVLVDQTGSRRWTRTPDLDPETLGVLIDLIERRGGEIGMGLIRDESNRGLLRLRIEPLPPAPTPPAEDGNLFEVAQYRVRYEERLSKHGYDCDRREQISRQHINSFLAELEPLLDPDQDAASTDVWGAVRRAALFLQENDAAWGATTENWAVFVSDGEDNVGSTPVSLPGSVRTVVVNGSAETGTLNQLNPLRFESARAAFDFIAADKERAQ